jgi:hypothetical protein
MFACLPGAHFEDREHISVHQNDICRFGALLVAGVADEETARGGNSPNMLGSGYASSSAGGCRPASSGVPLPESPIGPTTYLTN